MSKYFKFLVLTMLSVGLMTGSAFAAASLNAGNTTVASELVPVAGLAIPTVNTGYQPAGAVAVSSQIKISLTNGTFTAASNVAICDSAGLAGGTYGTAVVAAAPNNASVTITTTKLLASGTVYHFEPAAVCGAVLAPLTNVNIAAGAVGGAVVTMTVDNNLNPGDTNIYAQAAVTTLVDQLSAVLITPAADVIDFSAVPTMTKFKAGGSGTTTSESVAKIVVLSNETLGTKIASGHAGSNTTCGAWPATAEALSFTATPGTGTTMGTGFHATTAFQADEGTRAGADFVLDAAIASTDANSTGTATLNANLGAFTCGAGASATLQGTAANQIHAILTVDGTTALTARSYKLAVGTTTSAAIAAAARTLLAATTAWTWTLDATQYYMPLIKTGTGMETYIKLQSKSALSGSNGVNVSVLASDGSMVSITPTPASITSGTPYTLTGSDLATAVTAAGKTVSGTTGFAAIITVNTPPADMFGYANTCDSTGCKRIPLKTVYAAGAAQISE